MIKAVIFDWGGVLIDDIEPMMIDYWSQSLGVTREKVKEAREVFAPDFQRGVLTEPDYWEKVCSMLGCTLPQSDSLCQEAFRYGYRPRQEMFDLIQKLRGQYQTAILSNIEGHGVSYFQEAGYDQFFNVKVFSCVEKVIKPEPLIYEIALKRLVVRPEQAVFIDDKAEYIKGAEAVEIQGILYQSFEQVQRELEARGVFL